MRTRSSSNLIVEPVTIPKRRNRRHSKQIVEPEFRTIVETLVTTMADAHTMSELLQAPTEGYGDAIVIPAVLAEKFKLKTTNLKNDITDFQQRFDESFAAGGNLLNRAPRDALTIIKNKSKRKSPSGSGSLLSDTVANPRGDVKAITTRSGVAYEEPSIPPTSFSLSKEVEREPEAIKDKITLRYKLRGCSSSHVEVRFYFKSLLSIKEKLFGLASTPLNENCSVGILKKLPEKLGDPSKFLIPCDFLELEECLALADLGASINLMPLSVWKKLSIPELTPTRMTLELAN
nr:reverse transcriptase domain-containing protein [Tanacetum cinerariifolium]